MEREKNREWNEKENGERETLLIGKVTEKGVKEKNKRQRQCSKVGVWSDRDTFERRRGTRGGKAFSQRIHYCKSRS